MPRSSLSHDRAWAASLAVATVLTVSSAITATADTLEPPTRTCTTANCQALILNGRVNSQNSFDGILTNAWVQQFVGSLGRCLRFDVTAESKNLAMTVVAPEGRVYTNLNKGNTACSQCPRVIVANSGRGVYTAVIASQGGIPRDVTFTLRVAAYNSGNANCTPATAPR